MSGIGYSIQPGTLAADSLPVRLPAAVGIDFGGTKAHAVVIDEEGAVLGEVVRATPHEGPAVVDQVADIVGELGGLGLPLGVGAPALIGGDGVVVGAPNLPGVIGMNFANGVRARLSELTEKLGVVTLDNDATCAALGELVLGAAQGIGYGAVVTLGTGIGGGLIVGGRVERGAHGFAGEIGHMIVDPGGPMCPCGRRGCWERYASGSGLGRLAREAAHAGRASRVVELAGGDPEAVRGEHVSAACAEGDREALAVMDSFGWWVALGLANLAVTLDLEMCVLGGGPVASGEFLLGPTRASFAELMPYAPARPVVEIVLAGLGVRAGAIGAAWMAYDQARR